jgi:hypothetical protein
LLKGYQDKYLLEAPQKEKEEKTVPNAEVRPPNKPVEKQAAAAKPAIKSEVKRKAATPQQKSARQPKKSGQKKKNFFSFFRDNSFN